MDKILGLTRGLGRLSKANREMRKLSDRAVAMVLDDGDTRPLATILQSLQSAAAEKAQDEEKDDTKKKEPERASSKGKTGRGGGAEAGAAATGEDDTCSHREKGHPVYT